MTKYKKLTPADVAPELGMTAQAVRVQMRNGKLPIGYVVKGGHDTYSYIIEPKKLYEYTGIKMGGYEPSAVSDLDYERLARAIWRVFAEMLGGMS